MDVWWFVVKEQRSKDGSKFAFYSGGCFPVWGNPYGSDCDCEGTVYPLDMIEEDEPFESLEDPGRVT